jgi:hypothetical protein
MTPIIYFIGGPLDLTKMAHRNPEPVMYCLTMTALTLGQVENATVGKDAIDTLRTRHVYRRAGEVRNQESYIRRETVLIYGYEGLESTCTPDGLPKR